MSNINELKPTINLNPFARFCCTIGNLPSSYMASLTYEEQLMWLCDYLKNTVIPTVNNNAECVKELQELYVKLKDYVDNYFKNLDVQNEINIKLDEMALDGTLQEIIDNYLRIKSLIAFNNVEELKNATNLINGSFAQTLGYYEKNDGGKALYKIRTITNEDVIDEASIIALYDENLIAELICNNVNVKQFGCKGDGITDDTENLQKALNYASIKNFEVIIPTPKNYYMISSGLNVPSGVAGIISEKYNYTGVIRPTGEGYTMLTIQPHIGFYCKNLTLGSQLKANVNGILFVGHTGINIFEHIRVYNLNGYGFKINAIWDSVLTDISIELCGNESEYAFSMNADGDTSNMTTVNRLQVEQANIKAIEIGDNTLSCVFNNIHSERCTVQENTTCWHFGGASTVYNGARIQSNNAEDLVKNVVLINGYRNIYNSFLIESKIETFVEGINAFPITINDINCFQLSEKTNQRGNIEINNSIITNLYGSSYTFAYNSKITNLFLDYMSSTAYSKFYNCKIGTIAKTSTQARCYLSECSVDILESSSIALITLFNCIIKALSREDKKISYSSLKAFNTTFNTDIILDNCNFYINNCTINGNLTYQAGSQVFSIINSIVSGSVSSRYSSVPTTTPAIGTKTENLAPSSGSYAGWVYTSNGWKGYGLIE